MPTPFLSTHTGPEVDDSVDKAKWTFPLWSLTSLTGGGAGTLDGVDVTGIATGTTVAVGIGGVVSFYQLQDTTGVESPPDLILPDAPIESDIRGWVLVEIAGVGGAEAAQTANKVKAGPTSGGPATPGYRSLVLADLPAEVIGGLDYQGVWNASTNSPALASGVGTKGWYYKVSVAGTTTIDTIAEWNIGDWIVFNGTIWDKVDNTEEDATTSLKGRVKLAQDLGGTADLPTVLQASKAFALAGIISPTQLAADTNDWNPTGLSTANVIRASTDASRNLTGLQGGADGRLIAIANIGSFNLVLKNLSGSSSAGNQFSLAQDLILLPNQFALLCYDNTSTKWRSFRDALTGTAQLTSNLVNDGDSLSASTYEAGLSTTETFTQTTTAVSGRTLVDMQNAAFASVDTLWTRNGRRNVVVIWGGTNDFAVDLVSVATVYDRLLAYCATRRRMGWNVIVCTMISRTGTGIGAATLDSLKNTFNALIRLHWPEFADGLADLAADTHLGTDGSYSNATYYNADGIHLIAAGYTLVSTIVSTAVNNLTNGYRWLSTSSVMANAGYLYSLTVAGVLKTVLQMDANDRLQIGASDVCTQFPGGIQVLGGVGSPSGSGGFELEYTGGNTYVTAYNRAGSAWLPLIIRGSTLTFQCSGAAALTATAGVINIPNLTASQFVKTDGSKNLVSALNIVAATATKTPSATPVWDFDAAEEETMSLTAAVTSMTTSNRGDGKKKTIWIVSDGTLRNLAVNASWIPIGPAIDASLAANKVGVLALHCKGTTEALVYYSYRAQP